MFPLITWTIKVRRRKYTIMEWQNGATNIGPVLMPYMYGICVVLFVLFAKPKKWSNGESRTSRFGFDPKKPPRVWILWIQDPLFDFSQRNAKSFFGFGNPDLDVPKR